MMVTWRRGKGRTRLMPEPERQSLPQDGMAEPYCPLPTAYCLPPTAYCLLPIAHCLLLPKEGALAASVDYHRSLSFLFLARSPPRARRRTGEGRIASPAGIAVWFFYRHAPAKLEFGFSSDYWLASRRAKIRASPTLDRAALYWRPLKMNLIRCSRVSGRLQACLLMHALTVAGVVAISPDEAETNITGGSPLALSRNSTRWTLLRISGNISLPDCPHVRVLSYAEKISLPPAISAGSGELRSSTYSAVQMLPWPPYSPVHTRISR